MSTDFEKTLSAPDYVVFALILLISAVIGIYYAIRDRKSKEGTEGYLLGGRKLHPLNERASLGALFWQFDIFAMALNHWRRSMGMVPVGVSMAVSNLSAISLLGTPAEIYRYGLIFLWLFLGVLIGNIITGEVFIPIYYKLKVSSAFEYLDLRFNRVVRLVATVGYLIQTLLTLGIVIYAPSLALNAVTGFNLWGAILSTGGICIFYTTLGGLKAVVWTDVFQALIMVAGLLAIVIQGSIEQGGFGNVVKICEEGGRTELLFIDFDPRYRHTVWGILFGTTFLGLTMTAVNQSQVQRFVACKTLRQAKGSLYLNWIISRILGGLNLMIGAIIYARYHDCDPISDGKVAAQDQLFPYITMDLFHDYPGLPGLIISCVYSGALSTVSSGINAMTCVLIQDFVKPVTKWSETRYTWLSKGLVVVCGALSIAVAYIASILGDLLEASFSINSLIAGPLVGLFSLGLLFPFANSLGALFGLLSGITMTTWLYVGKKLYPPDPRFLRRLPLRTDGCYEAMLNTTQSFMTSSDRPWTAITTEYTAEVTTAQPYPPIADFYAVSYIYFSFLGFFSALVMGVIVSLISGGWGQRKKVNPDLQYFFFDHWSLSFLPKKFRKWMRCGVTKEKEFEFQKEVNAEEDSYFNLSFDKKQLPVPDGSVNDAYPTHLESGRSCKCFHYDEEHTAL